MFASFYIDYFNGSDGIGSTPSPSCPSLFFGRQLEPLLRHRLGHLELATAFLSVSRTCSPFSRLESAPFVHVPRFGRHGRRSRALRTLTPAAAPGFALASRPGALSRARPQPQLLAAPLPAACTASAASAMPRHS